MTPTRSWFTLERGQDGLAHGQLVVVAARWVLVLTGLVLAMWNPGELADLRIQITVILALAVLNFYLHAQVLTKRPVLDPVVLGASVGDLAVISLLVASQGGSSSSLYIFYFPAILALSVAFPATLTALYSGAAMLLYTLIALTGPMDDPNTQNVVVRLLMIAAVAFCGGIFRTIEAGRDAATDDLPVLLDDLRDREPLLDVAL